MHISVLASETPFWKTYSWENQMTKQRRVVITGIGILSPVGLTLDENWDNITNGRSGIGHITQFDTTDFSCKIAGEVEGFNPDNYMAAKDAKRMDRFIQLGYAASMDAFKDSGLEVTEQNAERIGIYVGSGIGGDYCSILSSLFNVCFLEIVWQYGNELLCCYICIWITFPVISGR